MLFAHPVLLVLLLVRPVGGGGGGSLLCRCGCTSRQRQQHLLQPLLPLHHCYKCGARFLTTQYPPRPFVSGYHCVVGSRVMAKDRCSSPHTGQRGSLSGHFALSVRHHEAMPRLSFLRSATRSGWSLSRVPQHLHLEAPLFALSRHLRAHRLPPSCAYLEGILGGPWEMQFGIWYWAEGPSELRFESTGGLLGHSYLDHDCGTVDFIACIRKPRNPKPPKPLNPKPLNPKPIMSVPKP